MPQHPTSETPTADAAPSVELTSAEPPASAPRRPRRTRTVIVAVTAVIVLSSAGWAVSQWPAAVATGPSADFASPAADAPWLPEYVPDSAVYPHAWVSMNEALRAGDRERFLGYADGEAREQLALWWDNTRLIGWETAYLLPTIGSDGGEGAFLGAELAFSSRPLRGSGNADAGYRLTQGFGYDISTAGSGEDLRITRFEPWLSMPWDEGPIHVVRREHVVLYGIADEAALVERTADIAERGAVQALETITDLGGDVPMTGFVAGVTDDAERLQRWQFGEEGQDVEMDIAGYAQPTLRPPARSDLFESDLAVGDDTSGVLVVLGPLSSDQRLATFTHEFAHGLHYAAAPLSSYDAPPTSVYEGFATYVEMRSGLLPIEVLRDPQVQQVIAEQGADAFTDEALRGEDAWLSYVAAGSYFLFLAENGGDPWRLALDGADAWEKSLIDLVDDPAFGEQQWQRWAASR